MNISKKLITIYLLGLLFLCTLNSISAQSDYSSYTAFLGGMLCITIGIIWLIIFIAIAIWVYKDAEKRGENGALWLIIVIILNIIGLIIWLLVRGSKESKNERKCPNCGRPIPMEAKVCPYCGKKFEEF